MLIPQLVGTYLGETLVHVEQETYMRIFLTLMFRLAKTKQNKKSGGGIKMLL